MKTDLPRARARMLMLGTTALILFMAADRQAKADCGVCDWVANGVTDLGKDLHIIPDTPPPSPITPAMQNQILAPSAPAPQATPAPAPIQSVLVPGGVPSAPPSQTTVTVNPQPSPSTPLQSTQNAMNYLVTNGALTQQNAALLIGEHGAGLISQDGGGVVSNDGGSLLADAIALQAMAKNGVAGITQAQADKVTALISEHGAGLISQDGGGLISQDGGGLTAAQAKIVVALISQDGGGIISHNGSTIVSTNGGTLIGNAGGTLVSNSGGTLIGNAGGTLVSNSGGTLISQDGGGIIQDANQLIGLAAGGRQLADVGDSPLPKLNADVQRGAAIVALNGATAQLNDYTQQLATATKNNDQQAIALLGPEMGAAAKAVNDANATYASIIGGTTSGQSTTANDPNIAAAKTALNSAFAGLVATSSANVAPNTTAPAPLTQQQSEAQREQSVAQLQAANAAATSQTAAASQAALNKMIATLGTTHPTDPVQLALLNQLMAQNQLNQYQAQQGAAQSAWQNDANTVSTLQAELAKSPNDNNLKTQLQQAQNAKTAQQALIDAAGKNVSSAQTALANATTAVKNTPVPPISAGGNQGLQNALAGAVAGINAAIQAVNNPAPAATGRLAASQQLASAQTPAASAGPSANPTLTSLQATLAQDQAMVATAANNGNPGLKAQMQPTIDALNAKIAALQSPTSPAASPAPVGPVAGQNLSTAQQAQTTMDTLQQQMNNLTAAAQSATGTQKTTLNAQIAALQPTLSAAQANFQNAQAAANPQPAAAAPSTPAAPPTVAQQTLAQAQSNVQGDMLNIQQLSAAVAGAATIKNPSAAVLAQTASQKQQLAGLTSKLGSDMSALNLAVSMTPLQPGQTAASLQQAVTAYQGQAQTFGSQGSTSNAISMTVAALVAQQQLAALKGPSAAAPTQTSAQMTAAGLQLLQTSDPKNASFYQTQIAAVQTPASVAPAAAANSPAVNPAEVATATPPSAAEPATPAANSATASQLAKLNGDLKKLDPKSKADAPKIAKLNAQITALKTQPGSTQTTSTSGAVQATTVSAPAQPAGTKTGAVDASTVTTRSAPKAGAKATERKESAIEPSPSNPASKPTEHKESTTKPSPSNAASKPTEIKRAAVMPVHPAAQAATVVSKPPPPPGPAPKHMICVLVAGKQSCSMQ